MSFCYRYLTLYFLPLLVQSASDDIAIFYNVYIPEKSDHAVNIIKEQLDQRNNSIVSNAPLYYVTIGKDIGEFEKCSNCQRIKHYDQASEIETLSHLHDYCTTHQDERVLYIHNKGSLHANRYNEHFRHMLNKAVFSQDCLLLKTPSSTDADSNLRSKEPGCKCNICSARFSPIPFLHMSGNMWVSECSYIKKLIHPSKIKSTMTEMITSLSTEKFGDLISCEQWETAVERFAAEHWIGTHPDR